MVKCTRGVLALLAMRLKIDYGVTINFTETFNEQFDFCFGTSSHFVRNKLTTCYKWWPFNTCQASNKPTQEVL